MKLCRLLYCFLLAQYVSSDISLIIRNTLTVYTASGIIHLCRRQHQLYIQSRYMMSENIARNMLS